MCINSDTPIIYIDIVQRHPFTAPDQPPGLDAINFGRLTIREPGHNIGNEAEGKP